ncbi:Uncharacterised protein [Zhongshania aliphaticivorans]|uniref:Uncharacterized protein n=1 Tax=Zhongshania aliphaticivorans TaxID=1470434 RepID=A0A5S9P6C1_9GAMM|nr:hypothetical protein [Zhongshania aliphaticivorans]CAA0091295.1 Uncharacterised protein [Zhongshania aliphaticivorans]CAA0098709.1 Uncharacterised protein [Zhongshania aliphaticivorans]
MTNSKAINIGIPVAANIVLFVASGAAAQISMGVLPAIALVVALLLSATALSA